MHHVQKHFVSSRCPNNLATHAVAVIRRLYLGLPDIGQASLSKAKASGDPQCKPAVR